MNETTATFAELTKSGVISVTDGYRAKNSELGGDGLIFLRAGHVTDSHIDFAGVERFHEKLTPRLQDKTSRVGDVIITTKGNSTGRTSFVDGTMPTFVYSPHLSRWRVEDKKKIDPAFLRYWSRSPQFVNQMRGLAASTDMAPYLSLRDQQRLEITLPHIDEQRGIGEVLGSLDDKVEQNRRTGAKLEGLARAVFKAWFVDFEPVKAKARGIGFQPMESEHQRQDAAATFPGMPPETFAALPDRLVDSPLGPVPQGWEVATLDDVLQLQRGFDLPKAQRIEGPYPIYAASGLNGWHNEWRVKGPGVTTGRSGVLGNVFFADRDFWPLNTSLWVKEYRRSNPWHAYYLLQTVDLDRFNAGSAVPTLNRNHLRGIAAVMASETLLSAFATLCGSLFELMQQLEAESAKLATLRDYLLPRLLSGRVRVRAAEREIACALQ